MGYTLEETVNFLQEKHRDLEGVQWSPYLAEYPRGEIARSNMPCVLTIPEVGTWGGGLRTIGMNCDKDDRIYRVVVITSDTGSGIGTDFFSEVCRLIDTFGAFYNTNSIQSASGGDLTMMLTSETPIDSGIDEEIIHADTRYYGFQFTIRIVRKL